MEKIPCIKCTPKLWEYIKPYLKEWKYTLSCSSFNFSKEHYFLILNWNDSLGYYGFGRSDSHIYDNREVVTNVEEFLERAAKLKGFTYKRKDVMEINGIEIKPGMVIEIEDGDKKLSYVVFPLLDGELGMISYDSSSWDTIKYFIRYYSSKIVCIHDLTSTGLGGLTSGKVLWEKPKEVVLTMDEITEKFGIPVEQLKIKK